MKIQIRKGVFETNSSSVHTIAISKESPKTLPTEIEFCTGCFGWEQGFANPADYLFTALLEYDEGEFGINLSRLKEILNNNGIEMKYYIPKDRYDYYIDHNEDLHDFINAVLGDEKMLLRFLFSSDSCVVTGNDNSVEDYCPIHIDRTKCDYFHKGN